MFRNSFRQGIAAATVKTICIFGRTLLQQKNRIVADDVDDISLCLQAKEIPLAKYFPSAEDTNMLRIRMKTMISRILVEHLPHFKQHYGDTISWHIDHPHQHAASQKIEIVSSLMPKYSKI